MKMRYTIGLVLSGVTFTSGCFNRSAINPETGSSLTEVNLGLPADKDAQGNVLFDAYAIELKTVSADAACKAFEVAQADGIAALISSNMKVPNIAVSPNCDYELMIQLGMNGNGLDVHTPSFAKGNNKAIAATNLRYSSNAPGKGSVISITSTALKAAGGVFKVNNAFVYKLDGGIGPDQLKPADQTNLDIDIKIGNGNSQTSDLKNLDASRIKEVASDADLQAVIDQVSPTRRVVVQFAAPACGDCEKQSKATSTVVAKLAKENGTVFVHYLTQTPGDALFLKRWNLTDTGMPQTIVYSNKQGIAVLNGISKALPDAMIQSLASGGSAE